MSFYLKKVNLRFLPAFLIVLLFCEIGVFILVGKIIGVFPTLFLQAIFMMFGVILLQKKATLFNHNFTIEKSQLNTHPLDNVGDRIVKLLVGLLFIIPGFLTNIFALLLWCKLSRRYMLAIFLHYLTIQPKKEDPKDIELKKGEYYEKKQSISFKDIL